MAYFSFMEQAMHYMLRPHDEIARTPIDDASAWQGAEMRTREDWRETLTAGDVRELNDALKHARASGKPTAQMTQDDFPLPQLANKIAHWRNEIQNGRGFHVISGVPVQDWGQEASEIFFWCFGLHMGKPGAQNPQGDLLGHVQDTGESKTDPYVRAYRTNAHIAYHCDAADAVGLLCLNTAKLGGQSRIVSSVSVYNALLAERPDLAPRLFEPFLLDARDKKTTDEGMRYTPVPPCRYAGGKLRTFYHADYFRSVQRHDDVQPFTQEETELMDLYEAIAAREVLYLDMNFAPGDIQLVSNHTILHARTEYEDHTDPARKRHLLRLWLSLE